MITIKNVNTPIESHIDLSIESPQSHIIDAKGQLMSLPSIIDPDIHLLSYSDKLEIELPANARKLLQAGITTIIETQGIPPETAKDLTGQISSLLDKSKTPLRVHFFCDGNQPEKFNQIGRNKSAFKGVIASLDLAATSLSPPFTTALDRLFQIAAQEDLIVVIMLQQGNEKTSKQRLSAVQTVKKSVELAEKYSAQLCLQHIRTKEELTIIKDAKKAGILIYTEVALPHLFLTEADRENDIDSTTMFLPTQGDNQALWEALNDGTIDMIGSGNRLSSTENVSINPSLLLPALLTAYKEKKLKLDTLLSVTRTNSEKIFRLPPNQDVVLVDMNKSRPLSSLNPHNSALIRAWENKLLIGWPIHVITQGELFSNMH